MKNKKKKKRTEKIMGVLSLLENEGELKRRYEKERAVGG